MSRQNKAPKVKVFRLSVTDAESHRTLLYIKLSRIGLFITVISLSVVMLAFALGMFAFTPLRMVIPGYPDSNARHAAIQNTIRADSLDQVVRRWELYSENLLRVLEGREPLNVDSLLTLTSQDTAVSDTAYLVSRDSLLRETVAVLEQFELDGSERELPIEGLHFFAPLKGAVTGAFDSSLHPYIEISAPANTMVVAVYDGTVIFDGWMDEFGYVIAVQHENDIISIYKNTQKLLKKSGDRVSAGSPIALLGGSGTDSGLDSLGFELWYKGDSVDPSKYISF